MSSGGGTAPTGAAGGRPRPRRSRLARGLLTLAGALAATLASGALTSTASAQSSLPGPCVTSAAEMRAISNGVIPETWGTSSSAPSGTQNRFHNSADDGADWTETGLSITGGSGRIKGSCTTRSFGRGRMFKFPVNGGGLFIERIRVWTETDRNDMYLRLYSADGVLMAEDDDSGEGYNAFISLRVDGLPDRFVGEGSSNIPGTPVTWQMADGQTSTGLTGSYRSLWIEVGTYGQQPSYRSLTAHVEIDFGAPWGSDLAGSIVPQLGGLAPTGIVLTGFPTAEAAKSKRDTGEAFVAARFFQKASSSQRNQVNAGNEALERSNADLWFIKSPRGGVIYRRTSSLSTHAAAAQVAEHTAIRGSESNTNNLEWKHAFRGGDATGQPQISPNNGRRAHGMVPVFRYDYDPALAATGDARAMNDTGLDSDGDDICEEAGTESTVISLGYLSGAVNQYTTCVPKRGVAIKPRSLGLDEGTGTDGGDMTGTFRDNSDRLEPVGYFLVQFDEDDDFSVWPVVIDLNGAPHPQPGAALALGAAGSSGPTLAVTGLKEGMESPLHPDSDDANSDWALQILIDDNTDSDVPRTCLNIPANVDDDSTWGSDQRKDMAALDAYLTNLRIPHTESEKRAGSVVPLSGPIRNEPPTLTVGEFWVRELEPWFTGADGTKTLSLNRATSHARNAIYDRHPGLRAANELTATGFNFRSGRCYMVSIRYMEVHPDTGLPVGKGLKLRKEFVVP